MRIAEYLFFDSSFQNIVLSFFSTSDGFDMLHPGHLAGAEGDAAGREARVQAPERRRVRDVADADARREASCFSYITYARMS